MHLLREGQFGVASTFITEANTKSTPAAENDREQPADGLDGDTVMEDRSWAHEFGNVGAGAAGTGDPNGESRDEPPDLQRRFATMYHILQSLRNQRDLHPAIEWAKANSEALESRGSNLEFELCRLRFVEVFNGGEDGDLADPFSALEYARTTFPRFSARYLKEMSSLLGSLAFAPAIQSSPYRRIFFNKDAWEDVASSFTREFCGLLGLSERSPLYTAVTAGSIALPVLEKLERVMGEVGGQWTSANELPVSINRRC